jgi:hypothetical protein
MAPKIPLSFSGDLSDDPSQATLLDRLRGADVSITYGGPSPLPAITGTIVGVETKSASVPGQNQLVTQVPSLNLITADALVSIPLESIASLQIVDPALRAELKQALAIVAEGRDTSKRPVTINFAGKGSRKVLVGYLAQTPLWQTGYRLVLSKKPYLQGWAMVQNTSQDDWNNVTLTLVAGRPISFIQDLYSPVYVDRPIVQPQITGSPTPQLYSSTLNIDKSPTESTFAGGFISPPSAAFLRPKGITSIIADSQDNSLLVQGSAESITDYQPPMQSSFIGSRNNNLVAAGAKLGTALFAYDIKVPVTAPRQKSAMIPFVGTMIDAERVSIYNSDTEADHPLTGARLKNTTGIHLMGGPITVFDADASDSNAYVGDALIDDTEPNQSRLLSFAVDTAVDAVKQTVLWISKYASIYVVKGVLWTITANSSSTEYKFKNNSDQDRTIVVEHPYTYNDKLLSPATAAETTADVYRFNLAVPSRTSKSLTVSTTQTVTALSNLTDHTDKDLSDLIKDNASSQKVKDALQHVIDLRSLVAGTQAKIAKNEADAAGVSKDQDRIRQNMVVLDKETALYKRYATELDAQETQVNDLTANHETLETQLTAQQNSLSDYVQNLSVN